MFVIGEVSGVDPFDTADHGAPTTTISFTLMILYPKRKS